MRRFFRKTADALVSHRSREFCVFLFFLAVSAVFWMLQTLDETLQKDIRIKLELTDVPDDVVITSPLPGELRAVVSDKGTSLIRYVRYGVPPLRVSFADYAPSTESGKVSLPPSEVAGMVQSCLLGTSRVLSVSPDTLEFYFNHGACKSVPIRVAGDVDVSPEYYLLSVTTSPSEVLVYASPSVLDTLSAIYTLPVNLSDIKSNTTAEVGLQGIKGAKLGVEKAQVNIQVDVYMENVMKVPIHTVNFPASKVLKTFPSEVEVTYTVGYTLNKDIKPDDFVILLTYEQILAYQREGRTKIPVTLRSQPETVMGVRLEPEEVDYLVEKTDVEEEE
ncbi:MAG: YbbR-like domain-containing protein [Prevotellaceae bacterium]|nr:YbbR-like domain-containing protein [Prevotellaceae bacterium]